MAASIFALIQEDFVDELDAIRQLVTTFNSQGQRAKARLAAANSATLLVAATFEEFVREMAREHARAVVARTASFEKLPKKLASTAWKRSMESLARVRFDVEQSARESLMVDTQARFLVAYEFVKGDLTQDIYRDLIHNENNMRPNELNSLFNVAGLSDVCTKVCDKPPILAFFGESEAGKAHGKLLAALEEFFERRNSIAHALNAGQSSAPAQIVTDLDMLQAFSEAMLQTLDALLSQPTTVQLAHPAASYAPPGTDRGGDTEHSDNQTETITEVAAPGEFEADAAAVAVEAMSVPQLGAPDGDPAAARGSDVA